MWKSDVYVFSPNNYGSDQKTFLTKQVGLGRVTTKPNLPCGDQIRALINTLAKVG